MPKTHLQYVTARECAQLAGDTQKAWQLVLDYAHEGKIVADKASQQHSNNLYAGVTAGFYMGVLVALGALDVATIGT